MKTTTKNLSDTKIEITVTLDASDLKAAREQAITRLAREVKVAGFRQGKVPRDIAEKHINPTDLASHTIDIAVRTSVPKAFAEASKSPLVIPNVNVTKYVPDEMAEYTATADILPEVKLGDYKKLKVKKEETKVNPKDVDDVLDRIATSYAEKQVVRRPAKLGDEVVIDFEGKKDDVAFDGGKAKDFKLMLGSGQFIPGFEDGIVGHESGDRFDLNLTFPKDYHNEDLAGAKVVFSVLVKQVNEVKKPELTDEFAAKTGPFQTVKELRADIEKNLQAQNDHRAEEKYKDDLVVALSSASKVSAPEVLVNDQIRLIHDDIARNAAARGQSFEDYLDAVGQTEEDWLKEITPIAEQRVKASLVLQVLAREEKITVDDETVDAKVAELKDVYQKSPEALKNLRDPRVRQDIKNRLTIEKTLDYLIEVNSGKSTSEKSTKTTKPAKSGTKSTAKADKPAKPSKTADESTKSTTKKSTKKAK